MIQIDTDYTTTPWYVTWFEQYSEIHIQSAPEDSDNHVLSIHYKHSGNCPATSQSSSIAKCDPSICEYVSIVIFIMCGFKRN